MDIPQEDWEDRLEYLRSKKKTGDEFADELQQEFGDLKAIEYQRQVAAQDEAAVKGRKAEPTPMLTEREAIVARIETKIGQSLPSQFYSGPLPVKANLLCAACSYDRTGHEPLQVEIRKDLSACWKCHNSTCDLDGQIGKRWGKPSKGPEAVFDWDDNNQRHFARHYLYTGLPDVLRKRLMVEEDVEFDAGPDEPIIFLREFVSFMSLDATVRKYWARAINRYQRDLFAHAKAVVRAKVKGSGRPWPPKYIANDRSIMGRESVRKMIEEVYPYVRDQRWATRDCVEWRSREPDWPPPDEYNSIIAPILVTLNAGKTAEALRLSTDRVWSYLRSLESVGLIQRIDHLKHGRRLWSLGHWQQTENMRLPRPIWFLKNDPNLLARLRVVRP